MAQHEQQTARITTNLRRVVTVAALCAVAAVPGLALGFGSSPGALHEDAGFTTSPGALHEDAGISTSPGRSELAINGESQDRRHANEIDILS